MPLSDETPLYNGVIGGLDNGKLVRVVLELLGHKRGILRLVHLERWLFRRLEGLLTCRRGPWFGIILGPSLVTSVGCQDTEVPTSNPGDNEMVTAC